LWMCLVAAPYLFGHMVGLGALTTLLGREKQDVAASACARIAFCENTRPAM
jgi:hypothetical protein